MKGLMTMRIAAVALAVFVCASLYAGGPLSTLNGKAVVYKSMPIKYKIDLGKMGAFSAAEATQLAVTGFQTWQNVSTASLTIQNDGYLPIDVNGTNFTQYTTVTDFVIDGISPIIFDDDGAITDSLWGEGAKEEVIGFAGSAYSDAGADAGSYIEGESVMNGYLTTATPDPSHSKFTKEEFLSTFVHEFGHFLGLDHTQINGDCTNDSSLTKYVPTMYPTATVNDVDLGTLNPDDIVAISLLYPKDGFVASRGGIKGTVVRENGAPVLGANVLAIDPSDSLMNVYSTVSDYYLNETGEYEFQGLPAGSYWVKIEPIDPYFTEGSSVGPYSSSGADLSFVNPVKTEFYNGANESSDPEKDNPNDRSTVTVAAGATTQNINFVANGLGAGILLIEDFTSAAGTEIWDAGWTTSGTNITNPITVVMPGLSFSGYPSSGIGNAVQLATSGEDDFLEFPFASSGAVYLSFMMNVKSAQTGDYFIAMSPKSAQTSYYARVHVKSSGSGFLIGLSKFSEKSGGNVYGTTVLSFNTTYLVVVKYQFNSGSADDAITVFVQSSSLAADEPAAKEINAYTDAKADASDLGSVTLRQGSSTAAAVVTVDGIRVTTMWPAKKLADVQGRPEVPAAFTLEQNYPNPFNPVTTIRFTLKQAGMALLKVYDILGREIATLVNGELPSGIQHQVSFDASRVASGMYFYRLEAGNASLVRKMMVLK